MILLDIWMPDVDGITLLKEWGENEGPALPGDHDVGAWHSGDSCRGPRVWGPMIFWRSLSLWPSYY